MLKIDFIAPYPENNSIPIKAEISSGKITVLYGPSGCGKTSILRCLAALINPLSGSIEMESKVWFNSANNKKTTAQMRKTAFVFQDLALFPNLTVEGNLKAANPAISNEELQQIILDFSLAGLNHRKPATLSGGEKQRLALARSLAMNSSLILLDEPFASLDIGLKYQMYHYVKQLAEVHRKHVILVSHDVHEVIQIADAIIAWTENEFIVSDEVSSTLQRVLGNELWKKLSGQSAKIKL